jgi:hypothetical protein
MNPFDFLKSIQNGEWNYTDTYWYLRDILYSFNDIDDDNCPFTLDDLA